MDDENYTKRTYLYAINRGCEDLEAFNTNPPMTRPFDTSYYKEYTYLNDYTEEYYGLKNRVSEVQNEISEAHTTYSTAYNEWDQYCSVIESEYPGWQSEHQREFIGDTGE